MISAEGFLYTSTPAISSDGTSSKLSPRPPFALNTSRPLSSPRTKVRPRIITPEPSAEKWSVSSRAAKPVTVTPEMRLSVSVTLRSGSAPMSSAVTESMIWFASCLISCARMTLPRMPVTMTESSSTAGSEPCGASPPAVCARAGPERRAATPSAMALRRNVRRVSIPDGRAGCRRVWCARMDLPPEDCVRSWSSCVWHDTGPARRLHRPSGPERCEPLREKRRRRAGAARRNAADAPDAPAVPLLSLVRRRTPRDPMLALAFSARQTAGEQIFSRRGKHLQALQSPRPGRCAKSPRPAAAPGRAGSGGGRARSEGQAQGRGVAAVVHVPRRHPAAGGPLLHDRALLGVVEVVHLQADLHMIGDAVEDRAVELAEGVAVHRQLPRDPAVLAVVAVRHRQQVLAAPVVGEADLPRTLS